MTCTQPKNSPPAGAVDPAFVSRLQKRDKLRSIILWSVVIASSVAFGAMWRNP